MTSSCRGYSRYQYVIRYRTPEWHEAVDADVLRLWLRLRSAFCNDRGGVENTRGDIMPGAMPQGGSLGREQNTYSALEVATLGSSEIASLMS